MRCAARCIAAFTSQVDGVFSHNLLGDATGLILVQGIKSACAGCLFA